MKGWAYEVTTAQGPMAEFGENRKVKDRASQEIAKGRPEVLSRGFAIPG